MAQYLKILHGEVIFFFPLRSFRAAESPLTGLLYWAASTHRLFLYWLISRYACGKEDVIPDRLLGGDWQVSIGSETYAFEKTHSTYSMQKLVI